MKRGAGFFLLELRTKPKALHMLHRVTPGPWHLLLTISTEDGCRMDAQAHTSLKELHGLLLALHVELISRVSTPASQMSKEYVLCSSKSHLRTPCGSDSRSRPRLTNKPCLVTYDRLYRVAGWVEGQSIGIHARGAAGACRAGGSGCQAGGHTGRDAGSQGAAHREDAQHVLFGLKQRLLLTPGL